MRGGVGRDEGERGEKRRLSFCRWSAKKRPLPLFEGGIAKPLSAALRRVRDVTPYGVVARRGAMS